MSAHLDGGLSVVCYQNRLAGSLDPAKYLQCLGLEL
jgi:hypothetical protein